MHKFGFIWFPGTVLLTLECFAGPLVIYGRQVKKTLIKMYTLFSGQIVQLFFKCYSVR